VVWISIYAPMAWTSTVFVFGFLLGVILLFVAAVALGTSMARAVTAPIAAATARIAHLAETGSDVPGAGTKGLVEIDELLTATKSLVTTTRSREARMATAVGALAHDVRTDLRAIATVIQQSRDEASGDLHLPSSSASLVEREIARVRSMTSDLVLMMKTPEQREGDSRTSVDIARLVEDVVSAVLVGAKVPIHLAVEKRFQRAIPSTLIERTLRNLIDNAARYARTSVVVRVFDGLIVVSDDGPGFASAQTSARSVGVHGHGFEIASRLAEISGGRVAIERSDDRGTVVLVYL
jgi:signal transduction histidine kinase